MLRLAKGVFLCSVKSFRRNYTHNTSALSKNLERLNSGYKIGRAGDGAAGLAISEKMRAQITGLEAAQKNVKDGASLVNAASTSFRTFSSLPAVGATLGVDTALHSDPTNTTGNGANIAAALLAATDATDNTVKFSDLFEVKFDATTKEGEKQTFRADPPCRAVLQQPDTFDHNAKVKSLITMEAISAGSITRSNATFQVRPSSYASPQKVCLGAGSKPQA